jgi:lysophospholipase L1-like esterase
MQFLTHFLSGLMAATSFFFAAVPHPNSATGMHAPIVASAVLAPAVTATAASAPPAMYLSISDTSSGLSKTISLATEPASTPQAFGLVLGASTASSNYITHDELTAALVQATNSLRSLIYQNESVPNSPIATGGFTNEIAASNKIDQLTGTKLTNVTVSGVSGLTTSDIPDLSGNYLSVTSTSTARSTLGLGYASSADIANIATEEELSQVIAAWGDSLTSGTYPPTLSTLSGYAVYDGGVGGDTSAQIKTRMLAATDKYSFPTIIWAGRNDILQSVDPSVTEANIASMVAALTSAGNTNYVILSITNDSDEPSGSAGYNAVIALNNYFGTTYGSHYLDLRSFLVNSGLADAGLSPTGQDLADISNDVPPTSLHADSVHFNTTGYTEIAKYVESHISLLQPSSRAPISTTSLITTQGLRTLLASGLVSVAGSINVGNVGYKQSGTTILTASSTNLNTFVGQDAGANLNSSGVHNTALGFQALFTATSSDFNTAVGVQTLYSDTTGIFNDAFGNNALFLNTTGSQNSALGVQALNTNTTGSDNGAFGFQTLFSNTTGGQNQAFGRAALFANTTGSSNVAVGYAALNHNVSATSSTAVGYRAGQGSASYNNQGGVYLGYESGFNVATGSDYNTFLGYQAGLNVTTGNDNILIGANVNSGGTHVTTGSNNILMGYNVNTPATTTSNFLNIGGVLFGTLPATSSATSFSVSSTGKIAVGTTTPYARLSVWGADSASSTLAFNVVNSASTTVFAVFDGGNAQLSGTLTQSSDQRLKTNIQSLDASSSLSLIEALNPVTFTWIDPDKGTAPQLGFIAQQVQQVFPDLIATTSATARTPDGTLGLNYIGLIAPLVSSVQALYVDVHSLEQTVSGFADNFVSAHVTAVTADIQTANIDTANVKNLCAVKSDGTSVCVTGDQLASVLAGSYQQSARISDPTSPTIAGTSTPPTITVMGDDPAIIHIGDTYSDLGATITAPEVDKNLGIKIFLNGTPVSNIVVDTSAVATDTIDYVATYSSGNTATSTRTVIVQAAISSPTPPPSDTSSTTQATSTAQ